MTSKGMLMVRSAVLVCGLSVAAVGAAFAQDQAPPPPPPPGQAGPPPGGGPRGRMMDPGARADMLKQNLSLTDDQTSQVKSIFQESQTKMEALRSDSSLSQDDRRTQMMSIRKAENDKINALLTPDQKTKFAALQQQMRDRRGGAPGGPPSGGPPQPPPPPPAPQS